MKKCYIFGALPVTGYHLNITNDDYVIAADGGLKTLNELGIKPDLIVGDFDSLGKIPDGDNVIVHPVKKDDTDTMLAVKLALEKGFKYINFYGCLGGRLDHTLASIQTAYFIANNNGIGVFHGDNEVLTVIDNKKIQFSSDASGVISVFSLSPSSIVTENNLLYEINDTSLTSDMPLGVSNEFIGKTARISTTEGTICVVWRDTNADFIIGENNG